MDFLTTTLDNGMRVITAPMPGMYSVTVAANVTVGSRFEDDSEAGSAHLVEHMLFKGTERRPSAEIISDTIERVGGVLNASTDKELTVYWSKVSKFHAGLAMDLLADMVRNSLFEDGEFLKEQRVVIEELGMSIDSPQEWVHIVSDEQCWPGSPVGRDVAGTRESVAALTRAQVVDFYRNYYVPSSTIVVVAGGISHEDALATALNAFGDWTPGARRGPTTPPPASFTPTAPTVFVETRGTEQANLCVTTKGIPRDHADRYAFELLVSLLGGSTTSRLFLEIRERRGLAYDIHSYGNTLADTSALVTYAAVEPAQTTTVVTEILRQLKRLKREPVLQDELDRVKDGFQGRLLLGLEDTQSVAGWCGIQLALLGEVRQPEEVCAQVERVTREDILRVAEECFRSEYLRLTVLGPSGVGTGLRETLNL
jgi:predicted Zn-dependent peptidase